MALRRLWSKCLTKSLAQAVWLNNEVSWIELLMLAKCTLCQLPRGGKSHKSKRLSWTRNRLQRWLAGERAELWHDLPQYRRPHSKQQSADAIFLQRQNRCIDLTSEGGYSNACKALVSPLPLAHTADITSLLQEKHPPAVSPIDLSTFNNSSEWV